MCRFSLLWKVLNVLSPCSEAAEATLKRFQQRNLQLGIDAYGRVIEANRPMLCMQHILTQINITYILIQIFVWIQKLSPTRAVSNHILKPGFWQPFWSFCVIRCIRVPLLCRVWGCREMLRTQTRRSSTLERLRWPKSGWTLLRRTLALDCHEELSGAHILKLKQRSAYLVFLIYLFVCVLFGI